MNNPREGAQAVPTSESDLLVYLWGISDDEDWIRANSRWSLDTARVFGLAPRLAGIGYDPRPLDRYEHKVLARLFVLRELLQPLPDSQIVLIMDAFDTLFLGTGQQIVATFRNQKTQILVSAERAYTYQWAEYRHKFDTIDSPYRYVNAGTIIGYAGALRYLAQTCIAYLGQGFAHGNDQGLLGKFVFDTFDTPSFVRLDTSCELFWVTTRDAEALRESPFRNPVTDTRPLILHVIGGGREHAQLYREIGQSILGAGDPPR